MSDKSNTDEELEIITDSDTDEERKPLESASKRKRASSTGKRTTASERPSTSEGTASRAKRMELFSSSSGSEDTDDFFEKDDDSMQKTKTRIEAVAIFSTSSESEDDASRKDGVATKKSKLTDIAWYNQDLKPRIHEFDSKYSGCRANLNASSSALDCFQMFFSEAFMAFIAEETNKYHKYMMRAKSKSLHSRLNDWKDTTSGEMYCFLATTLLMSRVKKLSYSEYWSKDKLIRTEIFGEIISRDRYLLLLQMLHFNDNDAADLGDPLIKIRAVIDCLRASFKRSFYPFRNLCINESLLLFKGKLSGKLRVPLKKNNMNVKVYVLCDCETGYVQDFIVHSKTLNDTLVIDQTGFKTSDHIVVTLLQPYLNKGHTLLVNDRYASPALFVWLHEKGTNACGTVKKTRVDMPKMGEQLKKGETSFRSTDSLLALKWCNKGEIWMLSTAHSAEIVQTEKKDFRTGIPLKRPKCVIDYNFSMGTVNKINMIVSSIKSIRKNLKWYKKFFFHVLDISICNAHTLHKTITGLNWPMAKFHLKLIREILEKYHLEKKKSSAGRRSNEDFPLRLTGKHFSSLYSTNSATKKHPLRKCVVCSKNNKRRETRYQCRICDVGLCVDPCFEIYHTKRNY